MCWGPRRTAMARHRTLRAVVGWSWDLLRPDERLLAERVAVFPGGVTVESAAAVCAGDGVAADDVAELLASLVDKSLLQAVDDGRRLRMLETIREYGIEQLAGRDELLAMRDRHADHVAALVTAAQQHLTTRDQLPWLARLTAERDNILAALRHRCERGDADGAVRLAIEWGGQALLLGNHADSIGWLADALAVPGGHELPERWFARALLAMAALSTVAVPAVPGEPTHDIVTLADELARVPADVHPMLGLVRVALGFFSGDRARLDAIVERGLHEGSPWSRAAVQAFRANIAENDGDVAGMRIEADRALAAFEALGERWGMANTLRTIAVLRTFDGDLAGAIEAYERAHALIREMHSREDEAYLLVRLATLYLRTGDVERARATATAAGESAEVTGARLESVLILNLRAAVERAAGNDELARTLDDEAYLRSQALPPTHPALGHMRGIVHAVAARRAVEDGDLALARRRADEAYTAAVGTDDQPLTAAVGVTLAEVAVLCGAAGAAAEMLGATVALRGAADPTDLDVARVTAAVVATLGPATAAELDARGRALDRPAAYARLDPASWWP
ncbi:MAG: ATP-binding protein [Jatrophihabitans sp.]|uniref:ATP-binding protein n=1 Tax=Jatrophihabitans sp. TaxID=1932789 RepID=UPI003F7EA3E9